MNPAEALPARALSESRQLSRLAVPLVVNNLAVAGIGFADTVMAGRLGALDLAAVGVGQGLWKFGFLAALGVLMSLATVSAHAWGARRPREVGLQWRQALWLALVLAVLILLAARATAPLLLAIGVEREVALLTAGYVHAIAWGAPGVCLYLTLRFVSEGIGRTLPIMIAALAVLPVNVFGNWVFMFGNLGAPRLGAVGAGVASALSMWLLLLLMLAIVRWDRHYRGLRLLGRWDLPDRARLSRLLALGLPISAGIVAEIGLFTLVALMMGILGATAAAGHQVAMNYALTMFMVPLAISGATTVRVGQALGAGRPEQARFRAMVGVSMCCGFMLLSALVIAAFRDGIVALYTTDPAVAAVAGSLLAVAALFQVADGVQVGTAGALRGYQDTRVPMALCVVAYWLVGFPLAWYLGLALRLGPASMWLGMVAALSAAALLLGLRLHRISRRPEPAAFAWPRAPGG